MKHIKNILIGLAVLFLLVLGINFYVNYKVKQKEKEIVENYEYNISALNDSLKIYYDGQVKIYQDKVPTMALDLLLESEVYKNLSEKERKYYEEISKVKGLLASAQQELEHIKEFIGQQELPPGSEKTDTTIIFKKNTTLSDTVKTPSYTLYSSVNINDKLTWRHGLNLKLTLKQTWKEEDDKVYLDLSSSDSTFTFSESYSYLKKQPDSKKKRFALSAFGGPTALFNKDGIHYGIGLGFGLSYNILNF